MWGGTRKKNLFYANLMNTRWIDVPCNIYGMFVFPHEKNIFAENAG